MATIPMNKDMKIEMTVKEKQHIFIPASLQPKWENGLFGLATM